MEEKLVSLFNNGRGHFQVTCKGGQETFMPGTARDFFESEAKGLLGYKGIKLTSAMTGAVNTAPAVDAAELEVVKKELEAVKAENASLITKGNAKGKPELLTEIETLKKEIEVLKTLSAVAIESTK